MCCRSTKDGVDALGVKHRVNPGIQLVCIRSQNLGPIRLRNTVKASIQQPEQCFRLTCSFTFSTSQFAFLRHDRHHRLPLLIRRPGQRPLDHPPVDRVVRPVDVYMIRALENEQDDRAKVNGLFGSLNS